MATKKTAIMEEMDGKLMEEMDEIVEPVKDTRVSLRIEKIPGILEDDVLIAVNGVNYLIPRGKTVQVPDFVKAEYERSLKAQERLYGTQERLAYKDPAKGDLASDPLSGGIAD